MVRQETRVAKGAHGEVCGVCFGSGYRITGAVCCYCNGTGETSGDKEDEDDNEDATFEMNRRVRF